MGAVTTRPSTSSRPPRVSRPPSRFAAGTGPALLPAGVRRDDGGRGPGGPPPAVVSEREAATSSPLVSAVSHSLPSLHVDGELLQLRLVGTGMMPAEEQFPAGGQDGANQRRCTAAVASVRGGEFWPGHCSGHRHLPPFGNRCVDRSRRLRPSDRRPSTVSDPDDDRSCSRAALSWVTYRSSWFGNRCCRARPGTTR